MKRALWQFAWIFLLLAAQQGALTHSVWHLNDHLPAHQQHQSAVDANDHEGGGQSSESRLCDLHFALGALFAGGCASQSAVIVADLAHGFAASSGASYVARTPVSFRSRAPPVLL